MTKKRFAEREVKFIKRDPRNILSKRPRARLSGGFIIPSSQVRRR